MEERIVYVGYYCDQEYFDHLLHVDGKKFSQARQNLERGLIEGLSKECAIECVSYVPYSKTQKCKEETSLGSCRIKNICVKNSVAGIVAGAHHFHRYLKTLPSGTKVIMYAVNPMFVFPALLLRKRRGLCLITICSELPQYRRWKEHLLIRMKHKLQAFLNRKFDKYILLTEEMKTKIPVREKPYIVMEGVFSGEMITLDPAKKPKAVMYAGGLTEDNGIKSIIEAFEKSEADELWICGGGPLEQYVRIQSTQNPKIKYLGKLPVEQTREIESKAYGLLNVRDPENQLTLYSFPSKILEYMASGSLVISSNLQGIPREYFDFIIPIDEYSRQGIEKGINLCVNMGIKEYNDIVNRQQNFVQQKKSGESQARRVLDFVCGSVAITEKKDS